MANEITHVRLDNSSSTSEEHITDVRLSNNVEQTVQTVVKKLDSHTEYYFTAKNGSKAEVEPVHPAGKSAYIRTKANNTTNDNLLSLPRF